MSTASKRACQLSVEKLAKETNATESYLHTLTFADPEPSQKEAQRRFKSFRDGWALRRGKKFVWSVQRGGRTHRIHFHLVTTQRWDAAEMWDIFPRYGFGRYNVQPPKPVQFAAYVAKYVARSNGLDSNSRKWGVCGFKSCRVKDVVHDEIVLTRRDELPGWVISMLWRLSLNDPKYARRKAWLIRRFSQDLNDKEVRVENPF